MNSRERLVDLSKRMLENETIRLVVPESARNSGWLGYPGCDKTQILDAEKRLGVTFPQSLREFYLISNGWRNLNSFVDAILPVEQIDFLPAVDPELASVVQETEDIPGDPEYTDEQVTRVLRSIVLSTEGDSTTTLIDPMSDVGNGEWNVGAWASWHPAMIWSDVDWWTYVSTQGPTGG